METLIEVYFKDNHKTKEVMLDWFNQPFDLEYVDMSFTYCTRDRSVKYNRERFIKYLDEELSYNGTSSITLTSKDGMINSVRRERDYFDCNINLKVSEPNEVANRIAEFFDQHDGVIGFMCASNDYIWQNERDLDTYNWQGRPTEGLIIIDNPLFKGEKMVSLESLPGYAHYVNGLWLGSCWKMWFGEEMFKFIPKTRFNSVDAKWALKTLSNHAIEITLHENMMDFDKPDNRKRQWEFRKQVGVDAVAEWLEDMKSTGDPAVEIRTIQGGEGRAITNYYNDEKQNVPKSQATTAVYYEINSAGDVTKEEIKKI
ncbi:hypothetical protein ACFO9Q_09790 [Paenibacillus sp. GCM10023252]|uniref:hypothetical protein n=1 Tax=Paenibacillus sp. GCM10023252 TaxID=3252649 RepID=UPI00361662A7